MPLRQGGNTERIKWETTQRWPISDNSFVWQEPGLALPMLPPLQATIPMQRLLCDQNLNTDWQLHSVARHETRTYELPKTGTVILVLIERMELSELKSFIKPNQARMIIMFAEANKF